MENHRTPRSNLSVVTSFPLPPHTVGTLLLNKSMWNDISNIILNYIVKSSIIHNSHATDLFYMTLKNKLE
jgi:hypothetical protein